MSSESAPYTIFGQDIDVLVAAWANIVSWFVSTFFPSHLTSLLPSCEFELLDPIDDGTPSATSATKCISIGRPGGLEQLRVIHLKPGILTKGYNVGPDGSPFINISSCSSSDLEGCVILRNQCFSVNYADCCIRWGLYESAKQFVGWPICPGFDVAGTIQSIADSSTTSGTTPTTTTTSKFQVGDRVFGCSLFGAYSSQVLIPQQQLRKIPDGLSMAQAVSLPAAALTSLYALFLAGHYPAATSTSNLPPSMNQAILIHSCAGGVGGMMVQMSKILGLNPIVGIVGSTAKVKAAKDLGCDVVIDKSTMSNFWEAVEAAAPNGYKTIMDANGVSTMEESYKHLCATGRLIVFGFHSNLPIGRAALSPFEWLRMARKMSKMPAFDPMDLVVCNKAVMGFNLSFFADEVEMVGRLFDQIYDWLVDDQLKPPRIYEVEMNDIASAHELIMSGKSVGKIVLHTSSTTE